VDITVTRRLDQLVDSHGNAVIVVQLNRSPRPAGQQNLQVHGQRGHVCHVVFPWQREFWGAGVHTGRHDCPDGGCS
jgi:hypothetical protein